MALALLCVAQAAMAAAPGAAPGPLHQLELGFNIGYLTSAASFGPALARAAADGFAIRAYEPFTSTEHDPDKVAAAVEGLLAAGGAGITADNRQLHAN